ncbi:MAG: hypothetical protein ACOX2L_07990 [Anaerolineae bacterium]|jgi:capsular polysaccharide biosynthesis protein|nr:hypothetical protein [Chloroflexota bacterium]
MELRRYWAVIMRRAWLVTGLLAAVLLLYAWTHQAPAPTYSTSMRFVVGVRPEPRGDFYAYDRYYTWLTAEYLVDDLSEVVKSQYFAADVAALTGLPLAPGTIQGATSSGKLHRVLSISITWHNAQELAAIADGVVNILTTRADTYFAQLGTESAVISLIDAPVVSPVGPSLQQRLELPLRLALALLAGIALAILLDYVDTSVRHRDDLVALGPDILGEIPVEKPWRAWLPFRKRLD